MTGPDGGCVSRSLSLHPMKAQGGGSGSGVFTAPEPFLFTPELDCARMGLLDRFFGKGSPKQLVLRTLEGARYFPRIPSVGGRKRAPGLRCSCGADLEEVFITSGGPEADPSVWRAHPVALDGWRCTKCTRFELPRFLEVEEVTSIGAAYRAAYEAGRFDEAELHSRRIVSSWPGFRAARFELAQALFARWRTQRATLAPHDEVALLEEAEQHLREGLNDTSAPPDGILYSLLVKVLLAAERQPQALTLLDERLANAELPEALRKTLSELREYAATRADLYERGSAAVRDHMPTHERMWDRTAEAVRPAVAAGIADLLRHVAHNPGSWQALWLAAMAQKGLDGNSEKAVELFERAFALNPSHPDVARELAAALLDLRSFDRSAEVARAAVQAAPADAGLVANLGLTLLLAARLDEALTEARRSVAMAPDDRINQTVLKMVEDVKAGRRPQPRSLQELEGR